MEIPFLENHFIKREIKRGSTSIVYHAVNTSADKEVVLKRLLLPQILLNSQRKETFLCYQNELTPIIELDHSNILKIYSFFKERDYLYIECDYLLGKTLQEVMEERLPLSIRDGIHIFIQAAEALSYAHSKGVFHKYLKPSNIFITDEKKALIIDFGMHLLNVLQCEKDILEEELVPEEISYMPAEQIKNEEYRPDFDLYSLAVSMYELFTGVQPFKDPSRELIVEKIMQGELQPPVNLNPNITLELNNILLKALDKEPANRYVNAESLLVDLKKLNIGEDWAAVSIWSGSINKAKGFILSSAKNTSEAVGGLFDKAKTEIIPSVFSSSSNTTAHKNRLGRSSGYLVDQVSVSKDPIQKAFGGGFSKYKEKLIAPVRMPLNKRYVSIIVITAVIVLILMGVITVLSSAFQSQDIGVGTKDINDSSYSPAGYVHQTPSSTAGEESQSDTESYEDDDQEGSQPPSTPIQKGDESFLQIICDVPGASVSLRSSHDYKAPVISEKMTSSETSLEVSIPAGVYDLTVQKEPFSPYYARIEMMKGHKRTVRVKLMKQQPRIKIITVPSNASVALNGRQYGFTPLSINEIDYGRYEALIVLDGYETITVKFYLREGEPLVIERNLVPQTLNRSKQS